MPIVTLTTAWQQIVPAASTIRLRHAGGMADPRWAISATAPGAGEPGMSFFEAEEVFDDPIPNPLWCWAPNPNAVAVIDWQPVAAAGSGGATSAPIPAPQSFTPTAGQTVFHLTVPAASPSSVIVTVNSVTYSAPDVSVSGPTVTWTSTDFSLAPTDTLTVTYI